MSASRHLWSSPLCSRPTLYSICVCRAALRLRKCKRTPTEYGNFKDTSSSRSTTVALLRHLLLSSSATFTSSSGSWCCAGHKTCTSSSVSHTVQAVSVLHLKVIVARDGMAVCVAALQRPCSPRTRRTSCFPGRHWWRTDTCLKRRRRTTRAWSDASWTRPKSKIYVCEALLDGHDLQGGYKRKSHGQTFLLSFHTLIYTCLFYWFQGFQK